MIYCKQQNAEVPLIIPFGGGVNSTAMVLGALDRGIEIDLIIFADTGGEKPETYEWLDTFGYWLKEKHSLEIVRVKHRDGEGRVRSLEEQVFSQNRLPSLAYGFKTCSQKSKIRPCDKYIKENVTVKEGLKSIRFVGYDIDEEHRYLNAKKEYTTHFCEFPLIEWGLDREACEMLILKHGFKVPMKSACFFCPASKKHEIEWLAKTHPKLFQRCVDMENNAELTSIKGLGRNYSWGEYIKHINQQPSLLDGWKKKFTDTIITPCECGD